MATRRRIDMAERLPPSGSSTQVAPERVVVLRALPFDEHDRLVAVGELHPASTRVPGDTRDPDALSAVAPQNYFDWATQQQVFEAMAAIASGWITLHQLSWPRRFLHGVAAKVDPMIALRAE